MSGYIERSTRIGRMCRKMREGGGRGRSDECGKRERRKKRFTGAKEAEKPEGRTEGTVRCRTTIKYTLYKHAPRPKHTHV